MGDPRIGRAAAGGRRIAAAGAAVAVVALAAPGALSDGVSAERSGPAAGRDAAAAAGVPAADTTHADTVASDTAAADTATAASAAPGETAGDTSVVYRREVFDYPAGARRNPFEPLSTGQETGPRLSDLTLAGILYSPDAGSVVVLVHPDTGRRYRLRSGDRIGQARLVDVAEDRAVFRVEAFGFDRRTVLRLKPDEERSP